MQNLSREHFLGYLKLERKAKGREICGITLQSALRSGGILLHSTTGYQPLNPSLRSIPLGKTFWPEALCLPNPSFTPLQPGARLDTSIYRLLSQIWFRPFRHFGRTVTLRRGHDVIRRQEIGTRVPIFTPALDTASLSLAEFTTPPDRTLEAIPCQTASSCARLSRGRGHNWRDQTMALSVTRRGWKR